MTTYTIQVSNHPGALVAFYKLDEWQTVHDGEIETDHAAKGAALELAQHYRFVRVFKDQDFRRCWYIPPRVPRKQQELIP